MESKTTNIFLFDLDGVLVKPGGYRKAVSATLLHLQDWCGLRVALPDEEDILLFEAFGITSEWDMIALTLAAWLETAAAAGCEVRAETFDQLRDLFPAPLSIQTNLADWTRRFGERMAPGSTPSRAVLQAEGAGNALFPHIPRELLTSLLGQTDDFAANPVSMLEENFVLGSAAFETYYQRAALVDTPSLLKQEDRTLIAPDVLSRLLQLRQERRLNVAAMTARQTLPENWRALPPGTCFPEGEMALELVGLQDVPLIGYGHLLAAAHERGELVDAWIKPSPVHALACCLAALSTPEPLQAAWEFLHGKVGSLPGEIRLDIFEDATVGLRSGLAAAELLRSAGYAVEIHLWGIATSVEKDRALVKAGARVFADVNAAVSEALASAGLAAKTSRVS